MQDLINIGYTILKEYNIFEVKIAFKDVSKGWSSEKGNISIPLWSFKEGKEYALYYVIHEIIHQVIWRDYHTFKHTKEFKDLEITLLERYNIVPKYAKAYPKALYNSEGTLLYQRA